ncbi:hypothetical protein NXS19_013202 [Fusarium pseudograminearum]|nr:hypothetical protein NXS19_013202 [Fusarium pseudograminearum]
MTMNRRNRPDRFKTNQAFKTRLDYWGKPSNVTVTAVYSSRPARITPTAELPRAKETAISFLRQDDPKGGTN